MWPSIIYVYLSCLSYCFSGGLLDGVNRNRNGELDLVRIRVRVDDLYSHIRWRGLVRTFVHT